MPNDIPKPIEPTPDDSTQASVPPTARAVPVESDWPTEAGSIPTGDPIGAVHSARRVVTGRMAVFGDRTRPPLRVMIPWAFSPAIAGGIAIALALAAGTTLSESMTWTWLVLSAIALGFQSVVATREPQNPTWPAKAVLATIALLLSNVLICMVLYFRAGFGLG